MTGILKQINRSNGGMPKNRADTPVMVGALGLEGDRQRNRKYHGGVDKAVLMLSADFVDDLAARGFPVSYGSLGENLTVAGLDARMWRAGQRFRVGKDVLLELTTLRQPCLNLDVYGPEIKYELYDRKARAGDPSSPRWARGGFYARVLHGGLVTPGDPVTAEPPTI